MSKFVFGAVFFGLVLFGTTIAVADNLSTAQLVYYEEEDCFEFERQSVIEVVSAIDALD